MPPATGRTIRSFTVALTLFVGTACSTAHAPERATAPASDIDVLVGTIRRVHPSPFFHESEAAFQLQVSRARQRLGARHTATATFLALAPLVASIGDAHTELDPYTPDYAAFRDHKGRLFPLELRLADSHLFAIADHDAAGIVPPGSQIESIAGRPIDRFLASFDRYTSGETSAIRRWSITRDLRPLMWSSGYRAPFRVTFRTPGGTLRRALLPGCTVDALTAWDRTDAAHLQKGNFFLRIDARRRIAILTMHWFDDSDRSWPRFVHALPRRLANARVRDLIIDLRDNAGGNSSVGDDLLNAFARRQFRDTSEMRIKVSNLVKRSLGRDSYIETYGDDAWKARDGSVVVQSSTGVDLTPPLPRPKRFVGNVYVVVGSGTYSSAAMFAAAAQDSRNATILGQESGGLPSLFAELYSFTLPQSRVEATVSTVYFVRPNGDRSVRGIQPDRWFAETAQGGDDRELRQVVAFVERRRALQMATEVGLEQAYR